MQPLIQHQSIRGTGADIGRQCFHSVYENIRLRPFTAVRRFQIYPLLRAFSNLSVQLSVFIVFVWPKRIKKFAFTGVCVNNRFRLDGALVALNTRSEMQRHEVDLIQ